MSIGDLARLLRREEKEKTCEMSSQHPVRGAYERVGPSDGGDSTV